MNQPPLSASNNSVTQLIAQANGGDEAAAFGIWERYFTRLVALVAKRLPDGVGRMMGPEDIASTAMDCLLRGAKDGRFRQLHNRDDLWQILVVIAVRRTCNVIRDDGRRAFGESKLMDAGGDSDGFRQGIINQIDQAPTADSIVMLQDTFDQLNRGLDEQQQAIVRYRLAGHSNEEIATKLGVVTRTIERKMRLIRNTWAEHFGE